MLLKSIVLVMGDDTDVISDRCAELLSHLLEGFIEERVNRLGKLPEVTMKAVVRHMSVHDAPETLNRVQMRSIGRQEVRLKTVFRAFQLRFQYLCIMVSGVVKEQVDCAGLGARSTRCA